MPSNLAKRHIEVNARLRNRTVARVSQLWRALPEYRDETLPEWLSAVVPLIKAAQRTQVDITVAYLSRALDRPVEGFTADDVMSMYRAGVSHEDVYTRPYSEVWTALADGAPFSEARRRGEFRATQTAATDVQLAMRDTLSIAGNTDDSIWGYQRVADGDACDFCLELEGAQFRTDDPMPIHPNCGCGVEPVVYTRGVDNMNALRDFNRNPTAVPVERVNQAASLTPEGVKIVTHGELGPVITDPSHSFTS